MLSFSPLLVVAAATLLSDAASASPFLVPRADAGSINITDPHAAPAVPANYTSPLANGGEAWAAAFSKAQELVAQMTTEEKTNITSGIAGPCVCVRPPRLPCCSAPLASRTSLTLPLPWSPTFAAATPHPSRALTSLRSAS